MDNKKYLFYGFVGSAPLLYFFIHYEIPLIPMSVDNSPSGGWPPMFTVVVLLAIIYAASFIALKVNSKIYHRIFTVATIIIFVLALLFDLLLSTGFGIY